MTSLQQFAIQRKNKINKKKKNRYQFLCQININNGSSLINVDWLCLSVKVNREVDGTLKCHLILLVLLTFFTANCQLILL